MKLRHRIAHKMNSLRYNKYSNFLPLIDYEIAANTLLTTVHTTFFVHHLDFVHYLNRRYGS